MNKLLGVKMKCRACCTCLVIILSFCSLSAYGADVFKGLSVVQDERDLSATTISSESEEDYLARGCNYVCTSAAVVPDSYFDKPISVGNSNDLGGGSLSIGTVGEQRRRIGQKSSSCFWHCPRE